MKKFLFWVLAIIIIVLAIVYFTKKAQPSMPAPSAAPTAQEVYNPSTQTHESGFSSRDIGTMGPLLGK